MKRIDVHTHILPKTIPKFMEKFGYGGFIQLEHVSPTCARMMKDDGSVFREITDQCWDPKRRIEDCTRQKVDIQVLSTVPVLFSYWAKPNDGLSVSQFLNDHLAGIVAEYPDRFLGLGTIPLQSPGLAVTELERCVRELGLSGVEIGTNVNGLGIEDPQFFPVYEAAESLGTAIFIHPWEMLGSERMKKYWLPWLVGMPTETALAICGFIFGGLWDRFPRLRVAFAHGGGSFTGTVGRIEQGFRARPDLCGVDTKKSPLECLGRFWVDSLVFDAKLLKLTLDTYGSHRVLLGSDYPFPLGEEKPGHLIEVLNPSDAVKAQLYYDNAQEWLGVTI